MLRCPARTQNYQNWTHSCHSDHGNDPWRGRRGRAAKRLPWPPAACTHKAEGSFSWTNDWMTAAAEREENSS